MRLLSLFFTTIYLTASSAYAACNNCDHNQQTHVQVSVGVFDVLDSEQSGSIDIEYQHHAFYQGLRPTIGLLATNDNAVYAYAGLRWEFLLDDTNTWLLAPNAAVGGYSQGKERSDLGHGIQFRTGVELAYILEDQSRVALDFSHLSNAGLGNRNPGAEVLQLGYALPF